MIEAEGLTKFYGPLAAIRDVTFQVEKGEVVGFLGPNGAGKSTTIRILTCFMPPSMGAARVDGLDCFERSLEVRRKVGYLPENVPLYTDLTVRRFLRFSAGAKAVEARNMESEIRRVIGICGLEKVSNRIIGHLSKGYRQRVGLAQALLNNPPVLVLDEPTNDLDIETLDLLEEFLVNYPGTVLMVSHDREFLNNVVTSTMVLEGNGVVQEYVGGYDDWLRQRKLPQENTESAKSAKPVIKKERPRKLTFNEKRELGTLPALIEKLEKEKRQLHDEMVSPDFYKKGTAITTVTERFNEVSTQLDQAYARWEILESIPKE